MDRFDLNTKAIHRLSELACLVDAIPGRFRESIIKAALGIPPTVDWRGSPLVQTLRNQMQDCVDDRLGFPLGSCAWGETDLTDLRSLCESLGACTKPAQVESIVSRIVSQSAQSALSTAREAQS